MVLHVVGKRHVVYVEKFPTGIVHISDDKGNQYKFSGYSEKDAVIKFRRMFPMKRKLRGVS